MFRKRTSWYKAAIKALCYAGLVYKISGMFRKSTYDSKKERKKYTDRYDCIKDIRKILVTLRKIR